MRNIINEITFERPLSFSKETLNDKPAEDCSISRERVYKIIDTERDYQDKKWQGTYTDKRLGTDSLSRTLDEFILYVHQHTNVLTTSTLHDDKLKELRKIAALCVAAMEKHGADPR